MSDFVLLSTALMLLPAGAAGLVGGLLYFAALRRTTAAVGGGALLPLALTGLRLLAAVAGFTLAAWAGPGILLAAFGGFLAARLLAVRSPAGGAP